MKNRRKKRKELSKKRIFLRSLIGFVLTLLIVIFLLFARNFMTLKLPGFMENFSLSTAYDASSRSSFLMSLVSIVIAFSNAVITYFINKELRERESSKKGLEWIGNFQLSKCEITKISYEDYNDISSEFEYNPEDFFKLSFYTKSVVPKYINFEIKELEISIPNFKQGMEGYGNLNGKVFYDFISVKDLSVEAPKQESSVFQKIKQLFSRKKDKDTTNLSFFNKKVYLMDKEIETRFDFFINIGNQFTEINKNDENVHRQVPLYSPEIMLYLSTMVQAPFDKINFTIVGDIGIRKSYFRMLKEQFNLTVICKKRKITNNAGVEYEAINTDFDYEG